MDFEITFTSSAEKDFKGIPKDLIEKILSIIEENIAVNPYVAGKKLKGPWRSMYSYRVANYRIVYQIFPKDQSVAVLRIKPRDRVYR